MVVVAPGGTVSAILKVSTVGLSMSSSPMITTDADAVSVFCTKDMIFDGTV